MEQESAKEKMGKWSIEGFLAPPSFYRRQLHWALKLKQAWIGARQVLMAITPCTTGLRTRFEDHARACPCGGDAQNVTTVFEQFWLPKPLLLGSVQRLKRWSFWNDPRNLEPVRSPALRFPAKTCRCVLTQLGTYGSAAMDLAAINGMRGSVFATSAGDKASAAAKYEIRKKLHILPSCVLDKAQFIPLVVDLRCDAAPPRQHSPILRCSALLRCSMLCFKFKCPM